MPIARDPHYCGPAGLDLHDPGLLGEVRALILTCPSYRRAVDQGMDSDELMSDILLGLIVRQEGQSRYDRTRSSLGTYIRLVSRSLVHHSVDRARRKGWLVLGDQDDAALDAALDADFQDEVEAEAKPTVLGAYVTQVTGGRAWAQITLDEAQGWRHSSEHSRVMALVYRVCEGLYLRHRQQVEPSFPAWVAEHYWGSQTTALDTIRVAWLVTHQGTSAGDLTRLSAMSWRDLRTLAREAFTQAHGTSRDTPSNREPDQIRTRRVQITPQLGSALARYRSTPKRSRARIDRAIEVADLLTALVSADQSAPAPKPRPKTDLSSIPDHFGFGFGLVAGVVA